MSSNPNNSTPAGAAPLLTVAAVGILIIHLALYLTDPKFSDPTQLHDSDAYMWLSRVKDLAASGAWFDHLNNRISPPEGLVQHWTRPMDVLLLAGALLLSPLVGFEDGLLYWGIVLSPLLHALTLLVLVQGCRSLVEAGLLPPAQLPLVGILFMAQVGAYAPFFAGRPDHHAPLALLFVLNLCLWLRLVTSDGREGSRPWTAVALGIVGAVAVWINVASLVFVAIGMAALCAEWIWWGPGRAGRNAVYGLALLGGAAIALLVEWGPASLSVRQPDTLSVSHLALFALVSAFWGGLYFLERTQLAAAARTRLLAVLAAGAGVLSLLALGFPELLGHPYGEGDPVMHAAFLEHTSELKPIHRIATGIGPTIGVILLLLGSGLAAMLYLVHKLSRSATPEQRLIFLFLTLTLAGYSVMAAGQVRWTDHVALAAVLPLSLATADCIRWTEQRFASRALPGIRTATLAAFVTLPPVMSLASSSVGPEAGDAPRHPIDWRVDGFATPAEVDVSSSGGASKRRCDIATASALLMDERYFPTRVTVLAHTNYGPELLYRTHHSVLSITNHRPHSGFRLALEILGSTDHAWAEGQLKTRRIGAIVLCASDIESGFFHFPDHEKTFVQLLSRGEPPAGFVLHAATEEFKIFRAVGAP